MTLERLTTVFTFRTIIGDILTCMSKQLCLQHIKCLYGRRLSLFDISSYIFEESRSWCMYSMQPFDVWRYPDNIQEKLHSNLKLLMSYRTISVGFLWLSSMRMLFTKQFGLHLLFHDVIMVGSFVLVCCMCRKWIEFCEPTLL